MGILIFMNVGKTIASIVRIFVHSKYYVKYEKFVTDINECIILTNGPSLKTDLVKYRDIILSKPIICGNFFALSEKYTIIKPRYYILLAQEFWDQNVSDHFKYHRAMLVDNLINNTSWNLKLFIPFAAEKSDFLQKLKANSNIKVVCYNNTVIEGFQSFINALFKANLGMPRSFNVLLPSIFLSINLGFKNIILLGADHSWHQEIIVNDTNTVTVNQQNFYNKREVRLPMYKLDGQEYHLHDLFKRLHDIFKQYYILQDYANYRNVVIQNASSKSFIDAFEKILIEDI